MGRSLLAILILCKIAGCCQGTSPPGVSENVHRYARQHFTGNWIERVEELQLPSSHEGVAFVYLPHEVILMKQALSKQEQIQLLSQFVPFLTVDGRQADQSLCAEGKCILFTSTKTDRKDENLRKLGSTLFLETGKQLATIQQVRPGYIDHNLKLNFDGKAPKFSAVRGIWYNENGYLRSHRHIAMNRANETSQTEWVLSISLGATARFTYHHPTDKEGHHRTTVMVESGDLLLFNAAYLYHSVQVLERSIPKWWEKELGLVQGRLNLQYRVQPGNDRQSEKIKANCENTSNSLQDGKISSNNKKQETSQPKEKCSKVIKCSKQPSTDRDNRWPMRVEDKPSADRDNRWPMRVEDKPSADRDNRWPMRVEDKPSADRDNRWPMRVEDKPCADRDNRWPMRVEDKPSADRDNRWPMRVEDKPCADRDNRWPMRVEDKPRTDRDNRWPMRVEDKPGADRDNRWPMRVQDKPSADRDNRWPMRVEDKPSADRDNRWPMRVEDKPSTDRDNRWPMRVEDKPSADRDNRWPMRVQDKPCADRDNRWPMRVEDKPGADRDNRWPMRVQDKPGADRDNRWPMRVEDKPCADRDNRWPMRVEDKASADRDNRWPMRVEDKPSADRDNRWPMRVEDKPSADRDNRWPMRVEDKPGADRDNRWPMRVEDKPRTDRDNRWPMRVEDKPCADRDNRWPMRVEDKPSADRDNRWPMRVEDKPSADRDNRWPMRVEDKPGADRDNRWPMRVEDKPSTDRDNRWPMRVEDKPCADRDNRWPMKVEDKPGADRDNRWPMRVEDKPCADRDNRWPMRVEDKPCADRDNRWPMRVEDKPSTDRDNRWPMRVEDKPCADRDNRWPMRVEDKPGADRDNRWPMRVEDKPCADRDNRWPMRVEDKPGADRDNRWPMRVEDKPSADSDNRWPMRVEDMPCMTANLPPKDTTACNMRFLNHSEMVYTSSDIRSSRDHPPGHSWMSETVSWLPLMGESNREFKGNPSFLNAPVACQNVGFRKILFRQFWCFNYTINKDHQRRAILALGGSANASEVKKHFYDKLKLIQGLNIPVHEKKIVLSFNDSDVVESMYKSGLLENPKKFILDGNHIFSRREQQEISRKTAEALKLIRQADSVLYESLLQVVACIGYYKAAEKGHLGGTVSSAIGLIWLDPSKGGHWSIPFLAESIVHEYIHTTLFTAEMVRGMYTDTSLVPKSLVMSAIRRQERGYDKSIHAAYVATGLVLFHGETGGIGRATELSKHLNQSVHDLEKVQLETGVLDETGSGMLLHLKTFLRKAKLM